MKSCPGLRPSSASRQNRGIRPSHENEYYDFETGSWLRRDFLTPESPRGLRRDRPYVPPEFQAAWVPEDPSVKRPAPTSLEIGLRAFGFVCVIGAIVWLVASGYPDQIPFGTILLGFLGTTSLVISGNLGQQRREPTGLDAPELTDENAFQVGVIFCANERQLGKDYGTIVVEEDRLIFVGRRTSFLIGGQDVDPLGFSRPVILVGTAVDEEYCIVLRHSTLHYALVFISTGVGFVEDQMALGPATRKALRMFKKNQYPTDGPRCFPPVERAPTEK